MNTYIEKEAALLKALYDNGFEAYGGYEAEADAIGTIKEAMESFARYADMVIRMQYMTPIYYAEYDGKDLHNSIEALDRNRTSAHENAIANLKILNRMCRSELGIPFADVDTSDRRQVADFVGEFISELYARR